MVEDEEPPVADSLAFIRTSNLTSSYNTTVLNDHTEESVLHDQSSFRPNLVHEYKLPLDHAKLSRNTKIVPM